MRANVPRAGADLDAINDLGNSDNPPLWQTHWHSNPETILRVARDETVSLVLIEDKKMLDDR